MRNLMKMGITKYYAHMAANSRKGHWFCANLTTVKRAMTKERLINSGFYDLATAYQSVHVNYWKRCIREPYVQCCERTAVSHRLLLDVRLAAHVANGWKFLIRPSSGKDTAKTKGVHRKVESEGRWRQISGLTNRNHIRLQLRIRLQNKLKSNNYSELTVVNVADIWRESDVWYPGRSRQRMKTEYEIRE